MSVHIPIDLNRVDSRGISTTACCSSVGSGVALLLLFGPQASPCSYTCDVLRRLLLMSVTPRTVSGCVRDATGRLLLLCP